MRNFFMLGALTAALFLSSCVASSRVTFNVHNSKGKPINAQVFVDGEMIGNAPAGTKMSNGIWNDPEVQVNHDGYRPYRGGVVNEVKAANIVLGLTINYFAWLWCYGPKKQQYVILEEQ